MPFEKGNKHAAGHGPKLFHAALQRAIKQDDGQRIREAAEKLLDLAAAGEAWALRELADRLDGKAHQSTSVNVNRTDARQLPDDELASIAAGSGEGTADSAGGAEVASGLH